MICGALQTLNEEAFEDVVASERPSPTGGPSTGETIASDNTQLQPPMIQQSQQPLTPIQETVENDRSLTYSQAGTTGRRQSHTISFSTNITSVNNNNNNNSIQKSALKTSECDCGIPAMASNRSQHFCNDTNKPTNMNVIAESATNNATNNNKTMSGISLHEQLHLNVIQQSQQHQSVSSSQSLSYQTNHLSSPSLLTLTNESAATDNNQIVIPTTSTSSASTVILMPTNACTDAKSFIDDTHL